MDRTAATNEARALRILAEEPGITGAELARRLDLGPRTGQRLLKRLQARDSGTVPHNDTTTRDDAGRTTARAGLPDRTAAPVSAPDVPGGMRHDTWAMRATVTRQATHSDVT